MGPAENTSRDARSDKRQRLVLSYSPEKRTALVLCGTGTAGAYHAGVLRAIREAGVKIDLVAGHGIGAASALLTAIDGGAALWDQAGLWRSPQVTSFYGWRRSLRIVGRFGLALAAVMLVPLVLLVLGVVMFGVGFALELLGVPAGAALIDRYSAWQAAAFAGNALPTVVPRVAMLVLMVGILVALGAVLFERWRAPARRRSTGSWWWRLLGAPIDGSAVVAGFAGAIWHLIRGGATSSVPSASIFGRRYVDVLLENLDQPGFRELLFLTNDVDARRDIVVTLLRERYRRDFSAPQPGRERRAEVLDVSGQGRELLFDLLAGALTPPVGCEPRLVTFPPESFWRGETHRVTDRPGCLGRLLEELDRAAVVQVIVVSAVATTQEPHHMRAPRLDVRSRLGDVLTSTEASDVTETLESAEARFDVIYRIAPEHNPVGAFEFTGTYDDASDRRHSLAELMNQGYEDAYRQFIDPIVGASGEQIAATTP